MDLTLELKFIQHKILKEELLSTGDAVLMEVRSASVEHPVNMIAAAPNCSRQDSDKDAFWGVGADRRGRNELGKALVRLRARLRDEEMKAGLSTSKVYYTSQRGQSFTYALL